MCSQIKPNAYEVVKKDKAFGVTVFSGLKQLLTAKDIPQNIKCDDFDCLHAFSWVSVQLPLKP